MATSREVVLLQDPPPPEVLFGAPERSGVVPCPDGARLAFLAPVGGAPNAWIASYDGSEARAMTDESGHGIAAVSWLADGSGLLCVQDVSGDENFRLSVVDLTDGVRRCLTPWDGVQAQLIGTSPRRPRTLAVAVNLADRGRHDLHLLDVDTAELSEPLLSGAVRYAVDGGLQPRFAVRLQPDGSAELVAVDEDGLENVLERVPAADTVSLIVGPVAVSRDGSTAFVLHSAHRSTVALHAYDLTTGATDVVFAHDVFDVADFCVEPRTGRPDLVCIDGERREWTALDASATGRLASLRGAVTGDLTHLARSEDDATWVVRAVTDAGSPTHFIDHRGVVSFLFAERPELDGYELGTTESFSFAAGDGVEVHGYVTAPPHAGASLPAVLWVHGGPWARDHWGYDPFVQLFATRGYACVQVNYRGSTGFGKAYLDAGDRQWGRRMQSDLYDALDALVQRGVINPARVAIAGGSYGGYAALMGLVGDRWRFRCGIAFCAPSNLITLLRSFPPYWAPLLAHWHRRVGDPETDADELWEHSPLAHVERLTAPLLLVHGANDPRVLRQESDAMAEALAKGGVPCRYHVVEHEGHGFADPANNVWLLGEMATFLAEHMVTAC